MLDKGKPESLSHFPAAILVVFLPGISQWGVKSSDMQISIAILAFLLVSARTLGGQKFIGEGGSLSCVGKHLEEGA